MKFQANHQYYADMMQDGYLDKLIAENALQVRHRKLFYTNNDIKNDVKGDIILSEKKKRKPFIAWIHCVSDLMK